MKDTLIASVHGAIQPRTDGDHAIDIKVPEKNSFVLDVSTQEIIQLPDKLTVDLANKFMRKAVQDELSNRDKNVSSIDRKQTAEAFDRTLGGVSFNIDTPTLHNNISHENHLKKLAEEKSSVVLLEYSDDFRSHLFDGLKPSITATDRDFVAAEDLPKKNFNFVQNGIVINKKSEHSEQFHAEIINKVNENEVIIREKEFSITSKGKIKDLMKGMNRKTSSSIGKNNTENSHIFKNHAINPSQARADPNQQEDTPKALREKPNPLETPVDNFFSYARPSQTEAPSKKVKDLMHANNRDSSIEGNREKRSSSNVKARNISSSLKAQTPHLEEPSIRKPSFKPQVVVSVDI